MELAEGCQAGAIELEKYTEVDPEEFSGDRASIFLVVVTTTEDISSDC